MWIIGTHTLNVGGEKRSDDELHASGMLTRCFPRSSVGISFLSLSPSHLGLSLLREVKARLLCYPSKLPSVCCIQKSPIMSLIFSLSLGVFWPNAVLTHAQYND